MKQVELIRSRVARGMSNELLRLRSYVACTDGNAEAVQLLCGDECEGLLAALTETVMAHLGQPSEVDSLGRTRESRMLGRGKRRTVLG